LDVSAVIPLLGPHSPRRSFADVAQSLACDAEAQALLTHMRLAGLACRSARKAPPIEACTLIDAGVTENAQANRVAMEMLMRSLPQAIGRMPVFHAPGASELSFDEAWLLQLVQALRAEDAASCGFLLRSRVPVYARRGLIFLINAALPRV